MPALEEVLYYLNGIWLLIRKKQEGFNWLDVSWRGLKRSFWAFAWCLPALAVIWASWRLYYIGNMPQGTTAGAEFVLKMLVIDVIGWLFPLVLIAALSGPLGYARHLVAIVTASNWIAVPFAYATAIPFAVTLVAPSAGVFGGLLLYAVFGAAWAILTEATLSFIGLVDPNSVSWGLMLNQVFASGAIRFAWWWVIPPGVSLSILLGALFLLARSLEGFVDRRLAE